MMRKIAHPLKGPLRIMLEFRRTYRQHFIVG
jgi:hypothetical protein